MAFEILSMLAGVAIGWVLQHVYSVVSDLDAVDRHEEQLRILRAQLAGQRLVLNTMKRQGWCDFVEDADGNIVEVIRIDVAGTARLQITGHPATIIGTRATPADKR